ncbi:hypothetical protein BDF21DRAFT_417341 [Thamnidium elegans]|nr:hypothetical protein BDF21DRAFT_417341 [Thamnidium elegans]
MNSIVRKPACSVLISFLILSPPLLIRFPLQKELFTCLNSNFPKTLCSKVSALAIGLAGLAYLLFVLTFPCFDETSTHISKARFFNSALKFSAPDSSLFSTRKRNIQ